MPVLGVFMALVGNILSPTGITLYNKFTYIYLYIHTFYLLHVF